MNNAQPGLSGALFVFGKKNKKAGAEDGKSCQKKSDSKLSQMMIQMFCHHIIPFLGC